MIFSERRIRVTGRIEETFDKEPTKFPILLPSSGSQTDMIIRDALSNVLHGGARSEVHAQRTLSEPFRALALIIGLKQIECH